MYTINIYKFILLKVGKRKTKYFELIKSYRHINIKELSNKAINIKKVYYDNHFYIDIVDEKTKSEMITKKLGVVINGR